MTKKKSTKKAAEKKPKAVKEKTEKKSKLAAAVTDTADLSKEKAKELDAVTETKPQEAEKKTPQKEKSAKAKKEKPAPEDINKLEQQAEEAFGAKRFQDAVDGFKKCYAIQPLKKYQSKIELITRIAKREGVTVNVNGAGSSTAAAASSTDTAFVQPNKKLEFPTNDDLKMLSDNVSDVIGRDRKKPRGEEAVIELIQRSHPAPRFKIEVQTHPKATTLKAFVVTDTEAKASVRCPNAGYYEMRF